MSALHGTFETSVASAEATKLGTISATETTFQVSKDAANSVVGLRTENGNASYVSTVKTANATKLESLANAEKVRQASLAAAREALRADTVGDGAKF